MCECDRRDVLKVSLAGALSLALAGRLQPLFAQDAPKKKAKACILLWLEGGPSQLDTFDPKPGVATGGPTRAIPTAVDGIQLSENFPLLAREMKRVSIIRSMTSREFDHGRASYYLHTGYTPLESVEYPSMGSVFAKLLGESTGEIPPYITIGGTPAAPGLLGDGCASFGVDVPGEKPTLLSVPDLDSKALLDRRMDLLRGYEARVGDARSETHRRLRERAEKYLNGKFLKALDVSGVAPKVREAYGRSDEGYVPFGQACLQARRLVGAGATFVEVVLGNWDTHENNFELTAGLSRQLDAGFASLVRDLRADGKLDETLIVCMGEFGRTPDITANAGRDHFPDAFSVALAGGGLDGGLVVGETNETGHEIKERPVKVPDLFATLLTAAGLDPAQQFRTPEGRPIKIVDGGKAIGELL